MSGKLVRTTSILVALLGGTGLAVGQQPSRAPEPQQRTQQEQSQQTPSGQAGKEEPSSHAPVAKPPDGAVLVNGALAVPGAPDTDMVPAKFSAKHAAADKLITIAYTFKALTDDERRAIYEALKDQPAGKAYNAEVGDELPFEVELKMVPDDVFKRAPQAKGYQYTVANDRVLLVSPPSRIVVGSFSGATAEETTQGRRAQ
jgi:hypothetical protein